MQPSWYTLPDFLIEQFPSFRHEIEEEYFFWVSSSTSNPYPHFFLMFFLGPILWRQQANATAEDQRRVGIVLEQILTSGDQDLCDAAMIEILEVLRDNPEEREVASAVLGPVATKWLASLLHVK